MKITHKLALGLGLALLAQGAQAQDRMKVAIGQRGVYENSISELGQDKGFFKKHGLVLELLYTQGSGETQQAVISGSVDVGIGVGTHSVMGAFQKGAPIRAIGSTITGAYEFWYVRADSPIKTFKDAADKTVAYSTAGSSTMMWAGQRPRLPINRSWMARPACWFPAATLSPSAASRSA